MARFRALTATPEYLAADRPDIQLGVREICLEMSAPARGSMARVKRLARYLVKLPSLIWDLSRETQGDEDVHHVFAVSAWAGCPRTRSRVDKWVACCVTRVGDQTVVSNQRICSFVERRG